MIAIHVVREVLPGRMKPVGAEKTAIETESIKSRSTENTCDEMDGKKRSTRDNRRWQSGAIVTFGTADVSFFFYPRNGARWKKTPRSRKRIVENSSVRMKSDGETK